VAGLSRVRLAGLRKPGHSRTAIEINDRLAVARCAECGLQSRWCQTGIRSFERCQRDDGAGLSTSPAPDSGESGHNKALPPFSCVTGCTPRRVGDCIETPRRLGFRARRGFDAARRPPHKTRHSTAALTFFNTLGASLASGVSGQPNLPLRGGLRCPLTPLRAEALRCVRGSLTRLQRDSGKSPVCNLPRHSR
jgi:hypothetical protein